MSFINTVKSILAFNQIQLADNSINEKNTLAKQKRVLEAKSKPLTRVRQDMAKWNTAYQFFYAEEPKNYLIQNTFTEAEIDALLTSQIQNRMLKAVSVPSTLVNAKGEIDIEQTAKLRNSTAYLHMLKEIWRSITNGCTVLEIAVAGDTLQSRLVPRANIVQQKGYFYEDYTEDTFTDYRKMKEYGKYILEFDTGEIGLLNKAIPHVLFKRFAQSCWSELCELYGIPPRVLTTNTQDTAMLNRAEKMMSEMAAAAWFIIDGEEKFEWAQSQDTNGDVYRNLINLCNNELSLLITGAVIGQDTQNGSRSKDESGKEQLNELVQSDLVYLEQCMNSTVIPALIQLGFLKGDVRFQFQKVEDLTKLWSITKDALPFYNVNPEWVKDKFGVDIVGERQQPTAAGKLFNDSINFFD
ncbi:DUF935 family protein [Ferruginibacter yonginensis]|uniref:DUF935 family protein n=1 Tax=Ferruginibacter yonginensis TaxID=1310416 RepID=A0ABV8QQ96_9BACT